MKQLISVAKLYFQEYNVFQKIGRRLGIPHASVEEHEIRIE